MFFDDGNRSADPALRLEIPEHHHCVTEIADVDRRLHRPHQSMLRQNQYRDDAKLIERTEELVHLQHEKAFLRHRVHVAVQAVDDDDSDRILLDAIPTFSTQPGIG